MTCAVVGFCSKSGGGGVIYLIYDSQTSHWTQKCMKTHDTDTRFQSVDVNVGRKKQHTLCFDLKISGGAEGRIY